MASNTAKTRIQALRERKLKSDERKLVDDVEKHGCHIIYVREKGSLPGCSYTGGLCETFHQPEIIVIGLKINTAQYLLNEIADRFKGGLQIQEGLRQSDLLENVECEFRRVEECEELKAIVGYATWFYGEDSFPVFQCVYPDLENRFPWEQPFDQRAGGRTVNPETNLGSTRRFLSLGLPISVFSWRVAGPLSSLGRNLR